MSTHDRNLDDPRLTAFALGELSGPEREEIAAWLAADPAARQEVEAIQRQASELGDALRGEPAAALADAQRAAVLRAAQGAGGAPLSPASPAASGGGLAVLAALGGVAVVVVLGAFLWFVRLQPAREVAQRGPQGIRPEQTRDAVAGSTQGGRTWDEQAPWGRSEMDRADETTSAHANDPAAPFGDRLLRSGDAANPVDLPTSERPLRDFESRSGEGRGALATKGDVYRGAADYSKLPASGLVPTTPSATPTPGEPRVGVVAGDPGQFRPQLSRQKGPGQNGAAAGDQPGPSPVNAAPAEEGEVTPGNEGYAKIVENAFLRTGEHPLSTFSIDVDTASYSNVRRFLKHQQWPPADAVRIEELVNYFRYLDAPPEDGQAFATRFETTTCPWNSAHLLLRIGIKGREIARDKRPPSNLVFLIDTSGSMLAQNKLPLVKQALQLLVYQMTEDDRLAIVTYAGNAGLALDSTDGQQKGRIQAAIEAMNAGGSTNGAAGIQLAYDVAVKNFIDRGTNRVLLCTDGDFNVGVSSDDELVKLIQDKAKSRVFLSVFGFGMGNLQDGKLEKLADKGNGHYAYIDTLREAQKVFVEDLSGTLVTIAKDVKIQVEFNPQAVGSYRLLGYENRILAHQDFNDDTKDAGEIGAGHAVTALYELVPAGRDGAVPPGVDPLKYQKPEQPADPKSAAELLTVKLRFKQPEQDVSSKLEFPLANPWRKDAPAAGQPSVDLEWAAAVAAFGMLLRNSEHKGQASFDLVLELAQGAKGDDKQGLRREFLDLVYTAKALRAQQAGEPAPVPPQLTDAEAEAKAQVSGKYAKLLRKVSVPGDLQAYGPFHEYGFWSGTSYGGENDLPQAHWVYVYPNWFLWAETTAKP